MLGWLRVSPVQDLQLRLDSVPVGGKPQHRAVVERDGNLVGALIVATCAGFTVVVRLHRQVEISAQRDWGQRIGYIRQIGLTQERGRAVRGVDSQRIDRGALDLVDVHYTITLQRRKMMLIFPWGLVHRSC